MLASFLGYQYFFASPNPNLRPLQLNRSPQRRRRRPRPGRGPFRRRLRPPQPPYPAHRRKSPPPLETVTTVENELFKIQFTNRGAQVQHWILKKYSDSQGKPLDLVQPQAVAHVQAAENLGLPLSLFTYDSALTAQLNQALYQVTFSGAQPTATGLVVAPASISFHYAANGLDVVKTFRFDSSYVIGVEAEVKQNGVAGPALVAWPAGLGDMEELRASVSGSLIFSGAKAHALFLCLVH